MTSDLQRIWRELGIPSDYATARGLAVQSEAVETELVEVGTNDEGRPVRLIASAAEAWFSMQRAAVVDGVVLLPLSGFRSVARQDEIIRGKLDAGAPLAEILRVVAAPGCSEHHTGRALDIGSPEHIELDEDFARTDAFQWLERHAAAHGFRLSYPRGNLHGISYEPWHWCWHPGVGSGTASR